MEHEEVKLSPLNEVEIIPALGAIQEIEARAFRFIEGLNKQAEYQEIIEETFDLIRNIVQHRKQTPPTDKESIKKLFTLIDGLESEEKKYSREAEVYDALFDFIKAARIVSYMNKNDLFGKSLGDIRKNFLNEAGIPEEAAFSRHRK